MKLFCVLIVTSACLHLAIPAGFAQQTDTSAALRSVTMDEVIVTAAHSIALFTQRARVVNVMTAEKLSTIPVVGVDEALKGLSSVDIRQRGGYGVQSDVSIRGGHYEQTLILLNGVNFSDPQTGHFNLNLPVCFESVRRIEVLFGSYARSLGANAMSGAINLVAVPDDSSWIRVSAMAGQHSLFSSGLQLNLAGKNTKHYFGVKRNSSKGYIENTDFSNISAFYSGNMSIKEGIFEFQTGYSQREFGANSFYTPKFPDQFEANETAIASLRFQSNGKIKVIPLVYWRHNTDRFELFRNFENAPSWYSNHNFHKTRVAGGSLSLWTDTDMGRTSLSVTYRNEEILSTVLGNEMETPIAINGQSLSYRYSYLRDYVSVLLDHQISFKNLFVSAGIMANINSDISRWKLLPGADASYMISKKLKVISSVNTSLRMPTFTDLFYSSPTLLGNPDLQYEQALTSEAGLKYIDKGFNIQMSGFNRRGRNLIDWIQYPGDSLWRSENITEIHYTGFEFAGILNPELICSDLSFIPEVQLSYTYLHVNRLSKEFQSAYALDQLKHKANFLITFSIRNKIGITYRLAYFSRYGSYMKYENDLAGELTPYEDFFLSDVRVYLNCGSWQAFADVSNVFNEKYFDMGNIEQPGRWIRVGGAYQLNFKK
jgi:vitamin B12 transporter